MTEDYSPSTKAIELLRRAWKAEERASIAQKQVQEEEFRKEVENALSLIDEAVSTMEKAGLDPQFYKIQKELFLINISTVKNLNEINFSGLIEKEKEALKYYEDQHNIVQQIETHIFLAVVYIHSGEKQNAYDHLEKVERIISATRPEDIEQHFLENSLLSNGVFLKLRQAEVERLKKYLADL